MLMTRSRTCDVILHARSVESNFDDNLLRTFSGRTKSDEGRSLVLSDPSMAGLILTNLCVHQNRLALMKLGKSCSSGVITYRQESSMAVELLQYGYDLQHPWPVVEYKRNNLPDGCHLPMFFPLETRILTSCGLDSSSTSKISPGWFWNLAA